MMCPDCWCEISEKEVRVRGRRKLLISCGCGNRWINISVPPSKHTIQFTGTAIGCDCGEAWGSHDCICNKE